MADVAIALDGISVIVKGHFNAAIFSPLWLLQQELIGSKAFTEAKIEVITSDIASFSTGWLNCQVLPDTLQFSTIDPDEFERLRDVAVGTLRALPHTPVAALGINRQFHFAPDDQTHYHAVGDTLVPKAFWKDLVDLPVTREVMIWGLRPDKYGGRVQIQVEPSFRFAGHIYVAHNDHFDLSVVEDRPSDRDEAWEISSQQPVNWEPSAEKIAILNEILTSVWAASIQRSNDVVNAIARIR
ncbi:hypothetical protein SKC41_15510 [Mycobacterium sp. 050128]|uniref:hypothetical protein n=1 Tax=Mycobacterium sp. 050128 TaxID=3096112 RepID=UPI002ED9ABE6